MNGRTLFIFSTKSLIYTVVAAVVGLVFYFIFSIIGAKIIGIVLLLIFALIGYSIGMFKVPKIDSLAFTRKVGGENIDDVIKRAIKFKMKKNRIYVYAKEEKEHESN